MPIITQEKPHRQPDLDGFVRQVRPSVERYVSKRVRNRDHAEEIVSRVFQALVVKWESFRGDCPAEAYVLFIASNALKNYYSRDLQKISRNISLDDWVEAYSLQHDDHVSCPYERLESEDSVRQLLNEMKLCCSEVECGVVEMVYQGHGFDEISELTSLNAATVRGHFLRARKKLLAHLYLQAPHLMGGVDRVWAVLDDLEARQPGLIDAEEAVAIRSKSGSVEVLRKALLKIAPYLGGI